MMMTRVHISSTRCSRCDDNSIAAPARPRATIVSPHAADAERIQSRQRLVEQQRRSPDAPARRR